MSQNESKRKALERAARLLWADELTDEEVARQLGISRKTLWRWKQRRDFQHIHAHLVSRALKQHWND